ncbi:MAG: tetratricopeptide repeat protein [SAR324 cluster bacterium]|nr:tetratricopeptide repeat protein [SAR324 cluster bacterium]MBL7036146.1 tetratricopeptide repeat protein [SAR324 cluster bacterium]
MQKIRQNNSTNILQKRYLLFSLLLLIFTLGCSSTPTQKTLPEKNTDAIAALQKTLQEQEGLLQRLQALTADLLIRNNELEQTLPPQDLLESLQNGFVELRKNKIKFERQLSLLQKQESGLKKQLSILQKKQKQFAKKLKKIEATSAGFSRNQQQILRGLLALQAGNPDQAVVQLQNILKSKKPSKLKAEILLALANGFLRQGHAKQAASHYGVFLREYPESKQVPLALFYLATAMRELGEQEKQKVLRQELIKNYPKSSFAKRAKKELQSSGLSSN